MEKELVTFRNYIALTMMNGSKLIDKSLKKYVCAEYIDCSVSSAYMLNY